MNRRHFFGAAAGSIAAAPMAASAVAQQITSKGSLGGLAKAADFLIPGRNYVMPSTGRYYGEHAEAGPPDDRYYVLEKAIDLMREDYEEEQMRQGLRSISLKNIDYDIASLKSVAPQHKIRMQAERHLANRDRAKTFQQRLSELRRTPIEMVSNLLGSFWNRAASMVKEET